MESDADAQARNVRRKFAAPPVKLACLSCRASRTRCNGGRPCTSCTARGHECVYRPSRRGGPRFRKRDPDSHSVPAPVPVPEEVLPARPEEPLPIQAFIDPGAALGQLPDPVQDSDALFDSLFSSSFIGGVFDGATGVALPADLLAAPSGPLVRTYRSDHSLLQAYYCWIHPYIPIFPPPETSPPVDEAVPVSQNEPLGSGGGADFEPTTPVALALSAVLALIPCAEDTEPASTASLLFRRKWAQFFAQAAIESIEADAELPESETAPDKALEATTTATATTPPPTSAAGRAPFHPRVPAALESIVALDLLSVYEYAQRGNIGKMRIRAGQALVDAMMTHALHAQTDADDDDFYAEARRRVWWATSSIVSNMPPPLELYGAVFKTKYPTLAIDPQAWPVFIEAQQTILAATQFVVELNKTMASHGDMEPIYGRMRALEAHIAPLAERAEAWTLTGPLAPPVDPAETCLVLSLRSMARIKLNSARIKIHRYCAFFDMPVFSGRHCDLKAAPAPADGYEPLRWSCSCSGSLSSGTPSGPSSATRSTPARSVSVKMETAAAASPESATTTSFSTKGPLTGSPPGVATAATTATAKATATATATAPQSLPPFSSYHSATICLRAAINIAGAFDGLPYPNPLGRFGQDSCFLSPTSLVVAPRMLPSYTCCAMQAAYVFLSIYRKTQTLPLPRGSTAGDGSGGGSGGGGGGGDDAANIRYQLAGMQLQLQRGLTSILSALENYGTAFEALRSMRDQIRLAAEQLMGPSG